jgi:uncharacterized membrane protein YtjA (UPF0391 family)
MILPLLSLFVLYALTATLSAFTIKPRGSDMLHYAIIFFVIALVAALFGFGGIAAGAAGIAKILFVVFLIGAVLVFFMGRGRGA